MPLLNGIEATRQISRRQPDVGVVILSMHAEEAYITLPIPNNPSFAGYSLFAQGASVSPLGVIATTTNYDSIALQQ